MLVNVKVTARTPAARPISQEQYYSMEICTDKLKTQIVYYN